MVNKVILCGILVGDLKKGGSEKTYAFGKIRVTRYGLYQVTASFKIWGNTAKWALEKGFKSGMGVQAIGNLSGGEDSSVLLNIDSMQEIPWLTENFQRSPWETKTGKNQAN